MAVHINGTMFQFYLQDTKSSNGTFVNDQRLCKGGEESSPREIYSGDLIQFGVNVMENNRRGEKSKNPAVKEWDVHGINTVKCICLKLFGKYTISFYGRKCFYLS